MGLNSYPEIGEFQKESRQGLYKKSYLIKYINSKQKRCKSDLWK